MTAVTAVAVPAQAGSARAARTQIVMAGRDILRSADGIRVPFHFAAQGRLSGSAITRSIGNRDFADAWLRQRRASVRPPGRQTGLRKLLNR